MAIALALVLSLLQVVPQHLWACTEDVGVAIAAMVHPCADELGMSSQGQAGQKIRLAANHAFQPQAALSMLDLIDGHDQAVVAAATECCSSSNGNGSEHGIQLCCVAIDQLATAVPVFVVPDYGPVVIGMLPAPAMTLVPVYQPAAYQHGLPALLPDRPPRSADPRPVAQLLV